MTPRFYGPVVAHGHRKPLSLKLNVVVPGVRSCDGRASRISRFRSTGLSLLLPKSQTRLLPPKTTHSNTQTAILMITRTILPHIRASHHGWDQKGLTGVHRFDSLQGASWHATVHRGTSISSRHHSSLSPHSYRRFCSSLQYL